jgi:tRNA1Val (adenine37-N6)-methyltransferase
VNIYGIKNGLLKRLILEFSPERKEYSETDFVIEKSPRKYSDQYLELTKEFHVFKG